MIEKIANFADKKAKSYGIQYKTFGMFGVLNYLPTYFYKMYFLENVDN